MWGGSSSPSPKATGVPPPIAVDRPSSITPTEPFEPLPKATAGYLSAPFSRRLSRGPSVPLDLTGDDGLPQNFPDEEEVSTFCYPSEMSPMLRLTPKAKPEAAPLWSLPSTNPYPPTPTATAKPTPKTTPKQLGKARTNTSPVPKPVPRARTKASPAPNPAPHPDALLHDDPVGASAAEPPAKRMRNRSAAGRLPGSGNGCPALPGMNKHGFADHALFCMSHINPTTGRGVLEEVARAAFRAHTLEDPGEFRGITVREIHSADGTYHLQGAYRSPLYFKPRSIINGARLRLRELLGTREDGRSHHLNVLFHHVYQQNDNEVVSGKKQQGDFKSVWDFDEMVDYLTEPSKDKFVDDEPLYLNCTKESIRDAPTEHDLAWFIKQARRLKQSNVEQVEAMTLLAPYVNKNTSRYYEIAMKAFECEHGTSIVYFLPPGMVQGDLEGADDHQIHQCRWLEGSPVSHADGLWMYMEAGVGKSTSLNLNLMRYTEKQVFTFVQRGSTHTFDVNGLIGYKDQPVIQINDLQGKLVGREKRHVWPECTLTLLKDLFDGSPKPFLYGHKVYNYTPRAKVLVTSNWPLPEGDAYARRWQVLSTDSTGKWNISEKLTKRVTPSDIWITPKPGLRPAKDVLDSWEGMVMSEIEDLKPKVSPALRKIIDDPDEDSHLLALVREALNAMPADVWSGDTESLVDYIQKHDGPIDEAVYDDLDVYCLACHVCFFTRAPLPKRAEDGELLWVTPESQREQDTYPEPPPKCLKRRAA